MKFAGFLPVAVFFSLSSYGVEVPDTTPLKQRDDRGAYQEVKIEPVQLTIAYFPENVQEDLKIAKPKQVQAGLFQQGRKHSFWGRYSQIFFQNGVLTREKDLVTQMPFCFVRAIVSFETRARLDAGIYDIYGTVTLVEGETHVNGSFGGPAATDGVSQGMEAAYLPTEAFNQKFGTAFNDFGNGKNDQGRIVVVGCQSYSRDPITVGTLKQAMGKVVSVTYP